jgi:16S rRNA (uracil1498-N3)-methyltransferase
MIEAVDKNQIKLKFDAITKNEHEPTRRVILYCAVLKRENFELVVQKAVEIGVAEIVPIVTERTVKTNLNLSRLEKIIKEAVEQSGRGVLPKISAPQNFSDTLKAVKGNDINWFCAIGSDSMSTKLDSSVKTIGVLVGPEGGWTAHEIEQAKMAGLDFVGLGRTVLRAETAAIVATFLAVNK